MVSKPVGVTSAPGGAGEDVVTAVCREFGVSDVSRAVAHRLDMETSGLLIVALTPEAQKWLYEDFREKRIKKTYEALVVGEVGLEKGEGSVKSAKDVSNPHSGPWQDVVDEGYLRGLQMQIEGRTKHTQLSTPVLLTQTHTHTYTHTHIHTNVDLESRNEVGLEYLKRVMSRAETSRPGHTLYERVGRLSVNGVALTRLRLYPQTGRTHQLRVFCRSHLNRAILGDSGYMHGGLAESILSKR